MELTEVKSGFFGYNKADVVRYISELNELHAAELGNKNEAYAALKGSTDNEIASLKGECKANAEKAASLEEKISKLTAELKSSIDSCNAIQKKYDALAAETSELRTKSDAISTAIIKAEKCAGQLMDDAKENADGMIRSAKEQVSTEKQKLQKAKECIVQARAELRTTLNDIDSALAGAQADLDAKTRSVDEVTGEKNRFDINRFRRA